jgi:hypothetical protein
MLQQLWMEQSNQSLALQLQQARAQLLIKTPVFRKEIQPSGEGSESLLCLVFES